MKKFISEFKTFIRRGSVMDLAVGVIIGGAFQTIVNSFVNDIIMPIIGRFTGGLDFSNLFIQLSGAEKYSTLAAAKSAGVAVIAYGSFITAVLNFFIMALVIFCIVRMLNRLDPLNALIGSTTKKCPYCKSIIDIQATRCPNCTSELKNELKD